MHKDVHNGPDVTGYLRSAKVSITAQKFITCMGNIDYEGCENFLESEMLSLVSSMILIGLWWSHGKGISYTKHYQTCLYWIAMCLYNHTNDKPTLNQMGAFLQYTFP